MARPCRTLGVVGGESFLGNTHWNESRQWQGGAIAQEQHKQPGPFGPWETNRAVDYLEFILHHCLRRGITEAPDVLWPEGLMGGFWFFLNTNTAKVARRPKGQRLTAWSFF